ncbi:MAG TPA: transglycosylase SLT domain-containing protein, partial [Pyrinomonadaceae bacterium]|nr:transglycosylase SLT domain-containing protein [Pyrinomonadaceae bacterium]
MRFSKVLVISLIAASAFILSPMAGAQSAKDGTLATVRQTDVRDANKKLVKMFPEEHLRRANVYISNRAFEEAREHWQALVTFYPNDPGVAEALLGIGRSYQQSRRYAEAAAAFDELFKRFSTTKEGREGLNFNAAALLRMGQPSEAAEKYAEYIRLFPNGERIETAHLNMIDTLREAGRPEEAIDWVGRTRQTFKGTVTETNAVFARLRLDVAESNWKHAVATADELSRLSFSRGVLTSRAEVAYLKGYSLERLGNKRDAFNTYSTISDSPESYYGGLALERLANLSNADTQDAVKERSERFHSQVNDIASNYPAPYRLAIVKAAKARKLDPRFVLAIIKQESVFKPLAKSPAGARGLLQLTIDAAQKYAVAARLNQLRESDLYRPETSIVLGSEYLAELARMFPTNLEPVAASYNGGEDNVARWVKRARHRDPGVFTAEIGFEETKNY